MPLNEQVVNWEAGAGALASLASLTSQEEKIFYVTEHWDGDPLGRVRRRSCDSLAILNPASSSDFASCEYAIQTIAEHPQWFGGLGFYVRPPYTVLLIHNAYDYMDRLEKPLAKAIRRLGGYWERRGTKVLQGILYGSVPREGLVKFKSFDVFVYQSGLCDVTGKRLHGRSRDPQTTDPGALQALFTPSEQFRLTL